MFLVSSPTRKHIGWGKWRFQISHVSTFFDFHTQQALRNQLLLLALRLFPPNRDTSTEVSEHFFTLCRTLLSFYFPKVILKRHNARESPSLGWCLPPGPLWIHHAKETVSMATGMLKKKKHGNICSLFPFLVPLALLCLRHGNYTWDKNHCSPLV